VAELPFTVTFGGPEVEGGRIPASNLARSLLALDQVARRTNALVNPGMPDVYLEARGARSGSYVIDLALQHAEVIGQGAIALFTSDPVSALASAGTSPSCLPCPSPDRCVSPVARDDRK
jgi:hypothetical protein